MRIELVYAPGCSTYRKALQILEAVIAEERLPIPIELRDDGDGSPIIRIDGSDVSHSSPSHNHEHLREHLHHSISSCWKKLTATA